MMRGKKAWMVLSVVGILVLIGLRFSGRSDEAPAYRSVQVVRGDLRVSVLATGVVQPENRLEIKPPVGGRVDAVLIEEGQTVTKGQILGWLSSTERAGLLDAAKAKGPAEVAHWEDLYKPTALIAPLDGVMIAKNIEPGQTVTAQDAVLVMSDRLIVKASVDETDIGQIRVAEPARITLDAYPDTTLHARVAHIAYEAKTVNNVTTYEVDVVPEDPADFMRSGMTANVTFLVAEKQQVLMLPVEGIQQRDHHTTVLVSDPGHPNGAVPRTVSVGITDGKHVEILSGVEEAAMVLVPTIRMPRASSGGATNPFSPWGNRSGQASRRGS